MIFLITGHLLFKILPELIYTLYLLLVLNVKKIRKFGAPSWLSRASDSWSQDREFQPHIGYGDYLKIKLEILIYLLFFLFFL